MRRRRYHKNTSIVGIAWADKVKINEKSRRVALTEAAQAAVKKEIAALVERYLEPHQPRRYRLNVIAVQPDGDYFYVVVRPDRDDYSDYDYYARLAETTRDIDEHENINLLLVPTGPG